MQRVTWSPMGKSGTVLHAIGVINSGGETAVSLCGYHEPLRTPEPGMKPCENCQETLKALVDTMPRNATVRPDPSHTCLVPAPWRDDVKAVNPAAS